MRRTDKNPNTNFHARCKHCHESDRDHVKGKCLYGPTYYEPWKCDWKHCGLPERVFVMAHAIACIDGQYYHKVCVASIRRKPVDKAVRPGELVYG